MKITITHHDHEGTTLHEFTSLTDLNQWLEDMLGDLRGAYSDETTGEDAYAKWLAADGGKDDGFSLLVYEFDEGDGCGTFDLFEDGVETSPEELRWMWEDEQNG